MPPSVLGASEGRRRLVHPMSARPLARLNRKRAVLYLRQSVHREESISLELQEGDFDAAEKRLAPLLGERGTAALAILIFAIGQDAFE